MHAGDPAGFFSRVGRVVSYAWLPSIKAGDLALLQLSSLTPAPAPAPAPAMPLATSADSALLTAGTVAAAEGWGVWQLGATAPSADLRAGGQIVQSASYCSAQAQSAGIYISATSTMCAIDPGGTYGVCSGDSGGRAGRPARRPVHRSDRHHELRRQRLQHQSSRLLHARRHVLELDRQLRQAPRATTGTHPGSPHARARAGHHPHPAGHASGHDSADDARNVTSTKFSAYTARGGYLSASVPADGLHVSWLRIGQQLRCHGGHTTYINDIFNGPSRGGWAMSATKPLKLTLSKPASRRFFRRTDTIILSSGPGGIYGSVRVTMRARATKLGTCTATVRSFRLRAPKS